jgi:hypothetical protein
VSAVLVRFLAAVLLVAAVTVGAQTPPTISEVQRLRLQNLSQRIELAQLRAQAAQREFDAAREELSTLVVSLKVEGYSLDLQTLTYTKDPPPAPPKK